MIVTPTGRKAYLTEPKLKVQYPTKESVEKQFGGYFILASIPFFLYGFFLFCQILTQNDVKSPVHDAGQVFAYFAVGIFILLIMKPICNWIYNESWLEAFLTNNQDLGMDLDVVWDATHTTRRVEIINLDIKDAITTLASRLRRPNPDVDHDALFWEEVLYKTYQSLISNYRWSE